MDDAEKRLYEILKKQRRDYCQHECPRRLDSEAGMPSCGPCPWEGNEDD